MSVSTACSPPSGVALRPFGWPKYRPPVSSRMTMKSTPATFSGLSGDSLARDGIAFTGRRLA